MMTDYLVRSDQIIGKRRTEVVSVLWSRAFSGILIRLFPRNYSRAGFAAFDYRSRDLLRVGRAVIPRRLARMRRANTLGSGMV